MSGCKRTVQLRITDGEGRGWLEPCLTPTEIRTRRLQTGGLLVEVYEHGRDKVGEGILRPEGGQWVGKCSEYAAWHSVSSRIGSGVLEFSRPEGAG